MLSLSEEESLIKGILADCSGKVNFEVKKNTKSMLIKVNSIVICRNVIGKLDEKGFYYVTFDEKSKLVLVDSNKEKNNVMYGVVEMRNEPDMS